jgi:hypothetical protein
LGPVIAALYSSVTRGVHNHGALAMLKKPHHRPTTAATREGAERGLKSMLKLLDRAITSVDQRLVLLAPPSTEVPDLFSNCEFDIDRHQHFVREVQRLRGGIYLQDGAIDREQLSPEGLHQTPEDERGWHLLMLDKQGKVTACVWYCEYDNKVYFGRLRLKNCALAHAPEWRDKLWKAVEGEIARARRDGLRYAEVGGWAVSHESRRSPEGLVLALAAYSLGRICGGVLGITTATTRHDSSSILCRIGGRPLEVDGMTLPPYYDAKYRCVMEILRFDSRAPSRRFDGLVERLHDKFKDVTVIARPYWPMTTRRLPCSALETLVAAQQRSLSAESASPAA